MSTPSRRFCKKFIKEGTSRQPATAEVAGMPLPPAALSKGHDGPDYKAPGRCRKQPME